MLVLRKRNLLTVLALTGLAVVVALAVVFTAGRGGQAQLVLPYGYPPKFLCGTYTLPWDPTVVVEMRTAVNVHNPTNATVTVQKKAVQSLTELEPPGQIGSFRPFDIPPDGAFEIDCADIVTLLGIEPLPFLKGFVVIHSPVELDVVGVYNAQRVVDVGTPGVGHAIDVDTIEVRPLPPEPVSSMYSANFVCGTSPGTPLAPGDYWTFVNAHNPNEVGVVVQKKVVLARPEFEILEPPTAWSDVELAPDGAFEVDCPDIYTLLGVTPPTFIKGFVVLYSPTAELDVVGVYGTTEEVAIGPDGGAGLKIDLEPVEPQMVGAP